MEQETARILVVDDDSELRLLIKEYLEKNGFTVDTVESGETMDGYLGNWKADLIILDLMLPGDTVSPLLKIKADGDTHHYRFGPGR